LKKQNGEPLDDLREQLTFLGESGAGFVFLDGGGRGLRAKAAPPESSKPGPPDVITAGAPTAEDVEELGRIDDEVRSCRLCPLHRLRTKAVPGEGNRSADLMFVGEAPGRDEDAQGRPFIGRAGKLLRKIIAAMKFREEDVYITNVVKCRPPENRTPHRDEVSACSPFLVRQIELIRPRVIVTLGKSPTEFFSPSRLGMTALRGKFVEYRGIPIMPTFHPSYLIRNEGNRELKRMVWEDMKLVMALLGGK
jgi:uracil-DNA glycosylase family 4